MAKQSFDPRATLATLEERHRTLSRQLTNLEHRAVLTPTEQRESSDLKKRKLAMKDAISALKTKYALN